MGHWKRVLRGRVEPLGATKHLQGGALAPAGVYSQGSARRSPSGWVGPTSNHWVPTVSVRSLPTTATVSCETLRRGSRESRDVRELDEKAVKRLLEHH